MTSRFRATYNAPGCHCSRTLTAPSPLPPPIIHTLTTLAYNGTGENLIKKMKARPFIQFHSPSDQRFNDIV